MWNPIRDYQNRTTAIMQQNLALIGAAESLTTVGKLIVQFQENLMPGVAAQLAGTERIIKLLSTLEHLALKEELKKSGGAIVRH